MNVIAPVFAAPSHALSPTVEILTGREMLWRAMRENEAHNRRTGGVPASPCGPKPGVESSVEKRRWARRYAVQELVEAGMKQADIAARMGVSLATVSTDVARLRNMGRLPK